MNKSTQVPVEPTELTAMHSSMYRTGYQMDPTFSNEQNDFNILESKIT